MRNNIFSRDFKWLHSLCFLVLLVCFCNLAQAHSPWVLSTKKVKSPTGEPLRLQSLCGDGVVTCSPITVQLVNKEDEVLAFTDSAKRTAIFCPSLESCWVFPYDSFFVTPLRLDYKHLDFGGKKQSRKSTGQTKIINGQIKVQGFVQGATWIKALSPLIIIGDNLFFFFLVTVIAFIPGLLFPFYFRKVFKFTLQKRVIGILFGVLLLLGCLYISLLFGVVTLITWSEPLVYVLFFVGLGLLLGVNAFRLLRKKSAAQVVSKNSSNIQN